MLGTNYDLGDVPLMPGDCLLFYNDGLVEVHNPEREMFGLQRVVSIVEEHSDSATLIDTLLGSLRDFTGSSWEQEDDVTLLTLRRNLDGSGEQIAAPVTAKSSGRFTP